MGKIKAWWARTYLPSELFTRTFEPVRLRGLTPRQLRRVLRELQRHFDECLAELQEDLTAGRDPAFTWGAIEELTIAHNAMASLIENARRGAINTKKG